MTKKATVNKTAETAKPMTLNKFLSVLTKPELCGTGRWFQKDKRTGTYCAVCPVAKAAAKRGFRFRSGQNAPTVISKKYGLNVDEVKTFTSEWDYIAGIELRDLSIDKGRVITRLPHKNAKKLLREAITYARDISIDPMPIETTPAPVV